MPLINPNSLVDPGHPLHIPGERGITLFTGKSRQARQRVLRITTDNRYPSVFHTGR